MGGRVAKPRALRPGSTHAPAPRTRLQGVTTEVQLCSSMAGAGARPETGSGGCYTSINGLPLAYYAQPWWLSKDAVCMGNKGVPALLASWLAGWPAFWLTRSRPRVLGAADPALPPAMPPVAASCKCQDIAPGDRVLHRVAQPFFYQ